MYLPGNGGTTANAVKIPGFHINAVSIKSTPTVEMGLISYSLIGASLSNMLRASQFTMFLKSGCLADSVLVISREPFYSIFSPSGCASLVECFGKAVGDQGEVTAIKHRLRLAEIHKDEFALKKQIRQPGAVTKRCRSADDDRQPDKKNAAAFPFWGLVRPNRFSAIPIGTSPVWS